MSLKGIAVRWTTAASVLILNVVFSVWYWGAGTISAFLVICAVILVLSAKALQWVFLKKQKSLVSAVVSFLLVAGLQAFQFWLSNGPHLKQYLVSPAFSGKLEAVHHRMLNVAGEEEIWLELQGDPAHIDSLIGLYRFPKTDSTNFPLLDSPSWFPEKKDIKPYDIYLYNDYDKETLHLLLYKARSRSLFYYYLDY